MFILVAAKEKKKTRTSIEEKKKFPQEGIV
jgi:hypothetical protein